MQIVHEIHREDDDEFSGTTTGVSATERTMRGIFADHRLFGANRITASGPRYVCGAGCSGAVPARRKEVRAPRDDGARVSAREPEHGIVRMQKSASDNRSRPTFLTVRHLAM